MESVLKPASLSIRSARGRHNKTDLSSDSVSSKLSLQRIDFENSLKENINDTQQDTYVNSISDIIIELNKNSKELKELLEKSMSKEHCDCPDHLNNLIKQYFLRIFTVVSKINQQNGGISKFIRENIENDRYKSLIKKFIVSVKLCAEIFVEYSPSFIAFLICYSIDCWQSLKYSRCTQICQIRSGIEFLGELYNSIKTEKIEKGNHKPDDFEVKFKEFKIDPELEEFDENIKSWKEYPEWKINEVDFPEFKLTDSHWWWKQN